jgi:hypothetical protein
MIHYSIDSPIAHGFTDGITFLFNKPTRGDP